MNVMPRSLLPPKSRLLFDPLEEWERFRRALPLIDATYRSEGLPGEIQMQMQGTVVPSPPQHL
jgi:hypothetical protein